ncbi:MAG: hypothetical protein FJX04_03695 [Alphaproteobacteria bacterium]|nr:hypothetical protein [Alphaproteobacteria bacterium]
MRRILPIFVVTVAVSACQGFSTSPQGSGITAAEASDAATTTAAKPENKSLLRGGAVSTTPKPPAAEQMPPEPVEPFRAVSVSAEALAASLIIPLPASRDSNASALEAERDRIDRLIAEGGLTREAGAKRLYRLAAKNGLIKIKADEVLWQTIIQAYRNLDDRYITLEDAAGDIAEAFQRRREAK